MVKVPFDFQDYDDDDPNISKRKDRFEFWETLVNLKKEYELIYPIFDSHHFQSWMMDTYGIKLIYTSEGGITDDYEIIDEKKYIIFTLRK